MQQLGNTAKKHVQTRIALMIEALSTILPKPSRSLSALPSSCFFFSVETQAETIETIREFQKSKSQVHSREEGRALRSSRNSHRAEPITLALAP
jgi:hypothetical protein